MRRFLLGWKVLGYARRFKAEIVNYADDFAVLGKVPAAEMLTAVEGLMERTPTNQCVRLDGKGRKTRTCPLWSRTVEVLLDQLGSRIDGPREAPVFLNVHNKPITRYGIHDLVARTATKAAETVPSLRDKRVSPHTIRHTTAVHLLRAGVDINTIRAWLGHVSLETTNRYAEVDLEMKAKALQTCAVSGSDPLPEQTPNWHANSELLSFLAAL